MIQIIKSASARLKAALLFCIFSIVFNFSFADVRLPSIIGSHMVLQQNSDITLWGWCDATEKIKITTTWDTVTYRTAGTRDATWNVTIKTPAAGGIYSITINGYNALVLEDVLIGEVWVCSGQSNMEWSGDANLKQTLDEMPNATNTNIRFFKIPRGTSDNLQDNTPGHWVVCNPEDMKHFSAIGYFFGKKLQHELNTPIGLISSSWGGTPAEVWTPKTSIDNDPVLKEAATRIPKAYPGWPLLPGKTYNAMIYPITNFSIAGVLWYQGETNVETSSTYKQLLSTMIGDWRKAWHKDFPFYFVQVAPYAYGNNYNGALLREEQTKVLGVANTGMVVISDLVSDVNNIHPTNKVDVALRLANYALAETYGKKDLPHKSPLYKSMTVEKSKIRIYFDTVTKGLMSKDGSPTEFYIAGADKKFVPATAKIDGNTVIVWSKEIKNPVAVRFAFSNIAMPNLFSIEGLPVNLFRTDDWEL